MLYTMTATSVGELLAIFENDSVSLRPQDDELDVSKHAVTSISVGDLLSIFENEVSKRDRDDKPGLSNPADNSASPQRAKPTRTNDNNLVYRQNPRRSALAKSIRDKVKLFDEGQITAARKIIRELGYQPEDAEFDPTKSKTVFDKHYMTKSDIERLCLLMRNPPEAQEVAFKQHGFLDHCTDHVCQRKSEKSNEATKSTKTKKKKSDAKKGRKSSKSASKSTKKSNSEHKSSTKKKSSKSSLESIDVESRKDSRKKSHRQNDKRKKDRTSKPKKKSRVTTTWESVLEQDDIDRRAVFGVHHRALSIQAPEIPTLTRERTLARRASTGRLMNSAESEFWRLSATHAVQLSQTSTNFEDGQHNGAASPHRLLRRLSTGSVYTCSNENEDMLVDFWHTYEPEEENSTQDAAEAKDSMPEKSFVRKRTVRFDMNTTVWVYAKDNIPLSCDLELPQSFTPNGDSAAMDTAPRPPVRRRNSGMSESSRDAAPTAPPRKLSSDSLDTTIIDSDEEELSIEEDIHDESSVDSWPRMAKMTRQTMRRQQQKQKRRVRFAEDLEEVRFYEKDTIPEVVLPQVGVVFCASTSTLTEDSAPRAPRRNTDTTTGLWANINDTIQALRDNEGEDRERREIDLMPRCPTRTDSLRSNRSKDGPRGEEEVPCFPSSDHRPCLVDAVDKGEQHGISVTLLPSGRLAANFALRQNTMREDSVSSLLQVDSPLPSQFTPAKPNYRFTLRPDTVRGDSFLRLENASVSSSTVHSSASMPLCPRCDSVSSLLSTESSFPSQTAPGKSNSVFPLRPTTIRGDSFAPSVASTIHSSKSLSLHPRSDSVSSMLSIESSVPSRFAPPKANPSFPLRPNTVRGDSFTSSVASTVHSSKSLSLHLIESSLHSKATPKFGDSFESFATTSSDESFHLSGKACAPIWSCSGPPIRPGTLRGNSFARLDDGSVASSGGESSQDKSQYSRRSTKLESSGHSRSSTHSTNKKPAKSTATQEIIWEGTEEETLRPLDSLHPISLQENSSQNHGSAPSAQEENSEGPTIQEIVWEGAGETTHSKAIPTNLPPHDASFDWVLSHDFNPHLTPRPQEFESILETNDERNTESHSEEPVPQKLHPEEPSQKSRRLPILGQNRRIDGGAEREKENSEKPKWFARLKAKGGKLIRRISND